MPAAVIRKYFQVIALTLLLSFGAVASFNLLVDPFSIFHLVEYPGLNQIKPEFFTHLRMAKAHAVRRLEPDSIILGTSRAEYGLDPDHPGWKMNTALHPYNLALSSCRIYEAFQYLKHAHAIKSLDKVVMGLDMFMFDDAVKYENDFDESRLAGSNGFSNLSSGWIHDLIVSLVSVGALENSYKTIVNQGRRDLILYRSNGMRNDGYSWSRIQAKGGHKRVDIDVTQSRLWDKDRDKGQRDIRRSIEYFGRLIEFSIFNDIELVLFISPVHARFLERKHKQGRWEDFEKWKIALVDTLKKYNSGGKAIRPVTLWDFSGYNSITTETFPPLGDTTTQMNWFWESTHYKKETGDLILDRVMNYRDSNRRIPEDFGIRLTADNVTAHLANIRKERKRYVQSNWKDIDDIWGKELVYK